MNKIILIQLLANFLKTILLWTTVAYCFGVILNLFEEIEFFKNLDVSILPSYSHKYFHSKYDNCK